MYLHLGNSFIIRTSSITAILDLDTATVSHTTRAWLAAAAKKNRVITATDEVPKSMVLTLDGTVYLSQLSSAVLRKRTGELLTI